MDEISEIIPGLKAKLNRYINQAQNTPAAQTNEFEEANKKLMQLQEIDNIINSKKKKFKRCNSYICILLLFTFLMWIYSAS